MGNTSSTTSAASPDNLYDAMFDVESQDEACGVRSATAFGKEPSTSYKPLPGKLNASKKAALAPASRPSSSGSQLSRQQPRQKQGPTPSAHQLRGELTASLPSAPGESSPHTGTFRVPSMSTASPEAENPRTAWGAHLRIPTDELKTAKEIAARRLFYIRTMENGLAEEMERRITAENEAAKLRRCVERLQREEHPLGDESGPFAAEAPADDEGRDTTVDRSFFRPLGAKSDRTRDQTSQESFEEAVEAEVSARMGRITRERWLENHVAMRTVRERDSAYFRDMRKMLNGDDIISDEESSPGGETSLDALKRRFSDVEGEESVSPSPKKVKTSAATDQGTKALLVTSKAPVKQSKTAEKPSETALKHFKTSLKKTGAPVEQSNTPAKKVKAPVKQSETPVKHSKTPVKQAKTPAKQSKTPVKNAKTPVKTTKTPVKTAKTHVKQSPVQEAIRSVLTRRSAQDQGIAIPNPFAPSLQKTPVAKKASATPEAKSKQASSKTPKKAVSFSKAAKKSSPASVKQGRVVKSSTIRRKV